MPLFRPPRLIGLPAMFALIAWLMASTASAQVARLDDSASPRAQVQADFRQAQMLDAQTLLLPFGRVEYRLATAPYVGRRARIYYVIPLAVAGLRSPSGLQVQWRGALFQSGMGRPGDRVVVSKPIFAFCNALRLLSSLAHLKGTPPLLKDSDATLFTLVPVVH